MSLLYGKENSTKKEVLNCRNPNNCTTNAKLHNRWIRRYSSSNKTKPVKALLFLEVQSYGRGTKNGFYTTKPKFKDAPTL